MKVSSDVFTLDKTMNIKNEKIFSKAKTSSASGLSFDFTQNQVVGPTQNSKTLCLNFLWIYF